MNQASMAGRYLHSVITDSTFTLRDGLCGDRAPVNGFLPTCKHLILSEQFKQAFDILPGSMKRGDCSMTLIQLGCGSVHQRLSNAASSSGFAQINRSCPHPQTFHLRRSRITENNINEVIKIIIPLLGIQTSIRCCLTLLIWAELNSVIRHNLRTYKGPSANLLQSMHPNY